MRKGKLCQCLDLRNKATNLNQEFKLANMLLKASLKNGDWNLVKEIMRFISSIDPADFDNGDVFDFQPIEQQSTPL